MLDVTLRADRTLGALLHFLDDAVGKGKYLVCLTADHGVCPLPEVSLKRGRDAGRILPKAKWIEAQTGMWLYLNQKLIASHGLEPAAVARTLADFLERQTGVLRAFTRAELDTDPDRYDTIGRRMRKAYFPDRSGDVAFVPRPYWLGSEWALATGTSHGSPHPYDTHVPLLVYGPNVKPGVRKEEVVPAAVAAIFARALGIAPPARAEYPAPAGLFERE